jgi:hypothetical protein
MRLREITGIEGHGKVDRERGIIPDVKIIGRVSKNGREYSDKALKEAASKYEGIEVNLNHPSRSKPGDERRVEDGFGWLESVRVRDDGVYGNLHYLKEHPNAGMIAEAAERRSSRFGLSHNAQGTVAVKNGKNVVESVDKVLSVDLVQSPATTNGLFESTVQTIREVLTQHAPDLLAKLLEDGALMPPETMDEPMVPGAPEEDPSQKVKAAVVALLTAALDSSGDPRAIVLKIMDTAQALLKGLPEPEQADPNVQPNPEDPNADPNAPPDQQAKDKNPDAAAGGDAPADDQNPEADGSANPFAKRKKNMAEATTPKSVEQRLAALEDENRQLKEKVDLSTLREECETLLRNHRREVTPARLTALANMPAEARVALIEEMPSIEEPEPRKPTKPSFMSPPSNSVNGPYPTDIKSFVEACR